MDKKIFILVSFMLLLSTYVSAEKLQNKNSEWVQIKSDYVAQYLDYNIIKISESEYKIVWQIPDRNELFFEIMKDCIQYDDEICFENKTLKYKDKLKNYDDVTKFWIFDTKYKIKDFTDQYLKKDDAYAIARAAQLNSGLPKRKIKGDFEITGDVTPYFNRSGELILKFNESSIKEGSMFAIGFSTVIYQFNNSLTFENMYIGRYDGYYVTNENQTRYLEINKFSNVSEAKITLTGLNHSQAAWKEFDYFGDGSVNTGLWTTATSTSRTCGGSLSTITESGTDSGLTDTGQIRLYSFVDYCATSGSTSTTASISSKNTTYAYANLKENKSLLLDMRGYFYANAHASTPTLNINIMLTNTTGGNQIIKQFQYASAASINQYFYALLEIRFDDINNRILIYNRTGTPYLMDNISSPFAPGSDKFIKFSTSVSANAEKVAKSELVIYNLGLSENQYQYKNYQNKSEYPEHFKFYVGGLLNYYNASKFDGAVTLDLKANLTAALSSGDCNCTGCVLSPTGTCSVPFTFQSPNGSAVYFNDLNVTYNAISYNLILIDEETGGLFNCSRISSCILYDDNNNTLYNFKSNNASNYTFFSATLNKKIRVEFGYGSGVIINRYIDTSYLVSPLRICGYAGNQSFNEQIFTSYSARPVLLKSIYANCYVAADTTRFSYSNSYALRAYTTDRPYTLYTVVNGADYELVGVDGGIALTHNLENLVFQKNQYSISYNTDGFSVSAAAGYNTTALIRYLNIQEDNTYIRFRIINMDDLVTYYDNDVFTNKNDISILFDYSSTPYTNATVFKVILTTVKAGGTEKSTTRYFVPIASKKQIPPKVAYVFGIAILIFGLSIASYSSTLSWFGIIITLIGIGIINAGGVTWYILLLDSVAFIILAYIALEMWLSGRTEVV